MKELEQQVFTRWICKEENEIATGAKGKITKLMSATLKKLNATTAEKRDTLRKRVALKHSPEVEKSQLADRSKKETQSIWKLTRTLNWACLAF